MAKKPTVPKAPTAPVKKTTVTVPKGSGARKPRDPQLKKNPRG